MTLTVPKRNKKQASRRRWSLSELNRNNPTQQILQLKRQRSYSRVCPGWYPVTRPAAGTPALGTDHAGVGETAVERLLGGRAPSEGSPRPPWVCAREPRAQWLHRACTAGSRTARPRPPRTVTGFRAKSLNAHRSRSESAGDHVGTTNMSGTLSMNAKCSRGKSTERTGSSWITGTRGKSPAHFPFHLDWPLNCTFACTVCLCQPGLFTTRHARTGSVPSLSRWHRTLLGFSPYEP